MRNLLTVFHWGCIGLQSHQQCVRVFSMSLPTFICCLFDDSPFWQMQGGIPLWFWFAFSWWLVILRIFSCAYWLSACLLWKNIHSDHLPIFKLDCLVWFFYIEFYEFLCILDMNPLLDTLFASVFSHSLGDPFVWVDSFLHCARVFKFEVAPFVYLLLFSLPEDTCPPKHYWDWCQRSLLLLFF